MNRLLAATAIATSAFGFNAHAQDGSQPVTGYYTYSLDEVTSMTGNFGRFKNHAECQAEAKKIAMNHEVNPHIEEVRLAVRSIFGQFAPQGGPYLEGVHYICEGLKDNKSVGNATYSGPRSQQVFESMSWK